MRRYELADTAVWIGELTSTTWTLSLSRDLSDEEIESAAGELARHAGTHVELLVWDEIDDDPLIRVATAAGWRRSARKAFVDLDLDDLAAPAVPDGWRLETMAALGEEEFAARMVVASEGDPFSPSTPESAVADLRELVQYAGEEFDPEHWFAVSDGDPLGVLLPQVYPDDPLEGTLFYLGVVPERRRQGLGSQLHRLGLEFLHERGAVRYVGSTDERNIAMLKVFAHAGARVLRRQTILRRPATQA